MNTGRYNVKSLFTSSEVEQIIIPEIQRDYVWKESNVKGLMKSIMDHFSAKTDLRLDIVEKQSGQLMNKDVISVLSEEYTRLVHSTRIGFIYAYHSPDFPGKFFLIDGQQRLTTIFLLLLASYKKAGCSEAYRKQYFPIRLPKIDYMVREITHDFMIDFIEHEIGVQNTDSHVPFQKSNKFYNYYESDATTSCIIKNYNVIEDLLEYYRKDEDEQHYYKNLINYVENYIEFNYFDTNISEQGEKLYLYMNSRGEDLSTQESLRPLLISRSDNKLAAGIKWEEWQNFFWENRGQNNNADAGFNEFLRWCTIIHICTNSDNAINSVEAKGDYIKIEKKDDKSDSQQRKIRQYQEDNGSFNIAFIEEVFTATKALKSILREEDTYHYIPENWLSGIDNTNDYPCLLSCIEYLRFNTAATLVDIRRVGMFIKNCMYYETNHKNPENATVNAIAAIKALTDGEHNDVVDLYDISDRISKTIYTNTDKLKRGCYNTMLRSSWEKVFWDITEDNEFSSFLEGETSCLFEWSNYNIERFEKYYLALKDRIINIVVQKKDQTALHEQLLAYGDLEYQSGTGIGMPRHYMLKFVPEWRHGINSCSNIREILKKFLDNETPCCTGSLYKAFVDNVGDTTTSVLGYMEYLEYLKDDNNPPHYILPRIYQVSGDNYRELMVQWVHQYYDYSWVYERDTVVLPFEIITEGSKDIIRTLNKQKDEIFFLDIQYDWNSAKPCWSFKLSSRNGVALPEHFNRMPDEWRRATNPDTGATEFKKGSALPDDLEKSIHERVQDVADIVTEAFTTLCPQ